MLFQWTFAAWNVVLNHKKKRKETWNETTDERNHFCFIGIRFGFGFSKRCWDFIYILFIALSLSRLTSARKTTCFFPLTMKTKSIGFDKLNRICSFFSYRLSICDHFIIMAISYFDCENTNTLSASLSLSLLSSSDRTQCLPLRWTGEKARWMTRVKYYEWFAIFINKWLHLK